MTPRPEGTTHKPLSGQMLQRGGLENVQGQGPIGEGDESETKMKAMKIGGGQKGGAERGKE